MTDRTQTTNAMFEAGYWRGVFVGVLVTGIAGLVAVTTLIQFAGYHR